MIKLKNETRRLVEDYIERIVVESTPELPLWNIESIKQGKKPHWNYIDGCMTNALLKLYRGTNNKKYFDFVKDFIDYYVFDDGSIRGYSVDEYNIDNISEGRVLFDLYDLTGIEKYRKAIELLYSQLKTHPRNCHNSFWHKLIYPDQVWLDGLYMGQVFYTRYETAFNNCKNYSDIVMQFQNVRKFMFNDQKKLYYHGFDASKKAFWADKNGLSANFWLRSTGWYIVALADVLEYLSPDYKAERKIFEGLLKEAIEGILLYLDKNSNMFYQVIDMGDKKGNYLESSGSAMIAYAIIKAVKLGILDKSYLQAGVDIFNGICDKYLKVKEDGLHLGGICLVAGLGPEDNRRRDGSFEYYISEPVVDDDAKGLGAFVMAFVELIQA